MDSDKNGTAFLADLADQVALSLRKRLHLEPDRATELGIAVASEVRRTWGGVSVYVCKTDHAAIDEKHERVWDAWRREGFSLDLCRRFGLSEQRVRQIVAKLRRERRIRAEARELPLGA